MKSSAAITFTDHDFETQSREGIPCPEGAFAELGAPETLTTLRQIVTRYLGSGVDAEDLLQDAIVRALRNWKRFRQGTNLHAWMCTIIRRLVIDRWRAQGRHIHLSSDHVPLCAPDQPETEPEWTRYSLSDVRQALIELPEPLRTTFRLYAVDGLGYKAISARLGIPSSTVGTRLRRARLRLRRTLTQKGTMAEVVDIRATRSRLNQAASAKARPEDTCCPPGPLPRPARRRGRATNKSLPRLSRAAIAVSC